MYTHTRTTFARYPFIPVGTSAEEFLALYLRHATGPPMFRTQDLERHVLAIDLRRFDLDLLEEAFEGRSLSRRLAVVEGQFAAILDDLLDAYGDPTLWQIELDRLPPLLTRAELC